MAPAHWAHGSSVMYMVARGSRSSPTFCNARCSARSSACAVGSRRSTVSLCASPRISPSATTTAPTGTSSRTEAARARRSAASIPVRSLGEGVPLRTDHLRLPRSPLDPLEPELVAAPFNADGVALAEVSLQQLQGDGVLKSPLDDTLERTSAIHRVVALRRDERLGFGSHLEVEVPLHQHLLQPLELEINDPHQILPA